MQASQQFTGNNKLPAYLYRLLKFILWQFMAAEKIPDQIGCVKRL
jgi:hypothetical protein